MSAMLCYVCQSRGDNIASDCREVYLEDDGHRTVYVGPSCFKKVEKAGSAGLVSGKGRGPRVFFTFAQAAAYAGQLADPTDIELALAQAQALEDEELPTIAEAIRACARSARKLLDQSTGGV